MVVFDGADDVDIRSDNGNMQLYLLICRRYFRCV